MTIGNDLGFTIGIKQTEHNDFVTMDSHSRDYSGLSSADGKGVLLKITSYKELETYVKDMVNSLFENVNDVPFEVTPLIYSKLEVDNIPMQDNSSDKDEMLELQSENNPYNVDVSRTLPEHTLSPSPLPSVVDVCNVDSSNCPTDMKYSLVNNRVPELGFKIPPKIYTDKRCKSGTFSRNFNRE